MRFGMLDNDHVQSIAFRPCSTRSSPRRDEPYLRTQPSNMTPYYLARKGYGADADTLTVFVCQYCHSTETRLWTLPVGLGSISASSNGNLWSKDLLSPLKRGQTP